MNDNIFKHLGVVKRVTLLFKNKNNLGSIIFLRHPDKYDIKYEANEGEYKKYEAYSKSEWDYLTSFCDITEVLFDIYERHSDWEKIETSSKTFSLTSFILSSKNLICIKKSVRLELLKSCGLPTDLIEARILKDYISQEAAVILSNGSQLVLKELNHIYS